MNGRSPSEGASATLASQDTPPAGQLDFDISCADGTEHANVVTCSQCGWNVAHGWLPWEQGAR